MSNSAKPKLLCVDDEPLILDGLALHLRREFETTMCSDPEEALGLIRKSQESPYALILSDMRMPIMDGATFLERARHLSPNSVRLLLTGYADLNSTVQAVNEGRIFRYISKPCPPDQLRSILNDSYLEYRKREVQSEILKKTLRSSVQVLTSLLGNVNPAAFGCASRAQRLVKQMLNERLPNCWQFELAALLSQIGCVNLPLETLNRFTAGESLNDESQQSLKDHPAIAANLLRQIPHLEDVANMVALQQHSVDPETIGQDLEDQNRVLLGGQLLRVAIDYDHNLTRGLSHTEVIEKLSQKPLDYAPALVQMLETGVDTSDIVSLPRYVSAAELANGMTIDEDLCTPEGVVLISQGTIATYSIQQRLQRFAKNGTLSEPFRVLVSQ